MGGGGGGGRSFPRPHEELQELFRRAKEDATRDQLDADINRALRELNATFERNVEQVRLYLDAIADILEDRADMDQFLFGGSVAKHTFVDGLSDIDALVLLRATDLLQKGPAHVLRLFERLLRDRLVQGEVADVSRGTLAVKVRYRDGTEVQLLPAVKENGSVAIPGPGGREWKSTQPKLFQRALTAENQRLNGLLVPTVKLVKSVNQNLGEQEQLTGYHIEALALDAAKSFRGPHKAKDLLLHVLDHTTKRIMRPIADVTGQSRTVDAYLGPENSESRGLASRAFQTIATQLRAATSADAWKQILAG